VGRGEDDAGGGGGGGGGGRGGGTAEGDTHLAKLGPSGADVLVSAAGGCFVDEGQVWPGGHIPVHGHGDLRRRGREGGREVGM